MIPELLSPAGDFESLKVALAYGADAVYLGGKTLGMRAFAGNFDEDMLIESVNYAHSLNKKVYYTANIFTKNSDLKKIESTLSFLNETGIDAVIVADPAVLKLAKRHAPNVPIHLSTQANVTNFESANFWFDNGVNRIVLARELSLKEIIEIRQNAYKALELEVFVHGAMCLSYSGRCYLSHYMTNRDANRGECAQSCRWSYSLMESAREGEYFPIENDKRGTYILNSKDLCLLPYLKELSDAKIDSLKIEGRMKTCYYVAIATGAYRNELDKLSDPLYVFKEDSMRELEKASHRPFSSGFLFDEGDYIQRYDSTKYIHDYVFCAMYLGYDDSKDMAFVEQRNNFKVGDIFEVMQPGEPFSSFEITKIIDEEGGLREVAPHAKEKLYLPGLGRLKPFSILRRKK